MENKCFVCDKKLGLKSTFYSTNTFDGQRVYVGSDCYKKISTMGIHGYQPPKGSPRLFSTMESLCKCHWPWNN